MPIRFVGRNTPAGRRVAAAQRRLARRGFQAMRRRAPRKLSSFARKVMNVVNRREETKYVANAFDAAGNALPTLWYPTGQLAAVGDFNPALPKLTQGTDDYQRVGNKIQLQNLAVSLKIGLNALDLSANSLIGVIYYGTSKTEKTWQGNNPLQTPAILDNGDGTNQIWGATRYDLTKPLDKKIVSAKRITFRLSKSGGIQNSDKGGATTQPGNFATSNGLSEKSFMLKFKAPKNLMYQTAGSVYPSNYAPWYAIGFCHADGSALVVPADNELVNVNAKCHMYFKDA